MSSKRIVEPKTSSGSRQYLRTPGRRKIHSRMKISAIANKVTRRASGYTPDSVETGIAAFIPAQLHVGEALTIEFTFPRSGQTFSLRGIVRGIEKQQLAS